jgi:prepilin-type N-terminal cleavage/methylation domain-containing protein
MRNSKKGFTLIELLIVVVIVGILALAAIPLITSNTRDARRAEGEQQLGAARNFIRVEFSRAGGWTTGPGSAQEKWVTEHQSGAFDGQYFAIEITGIDVNDPPADSEVETVSKTGNDGTGTMTFQMGSGSSTIVWAD